MHGDDYIDFLRDEFAVRGSTINLLGIVRCAERRFDGPTTPPESPASTIAPAVQFGVAIIVPGHDGPPCPTETCLPHVIYCDHHRPPRPFDPMSRTRYDRRDPRPDGMATVG
jgi:hypothetical protein